MLRERSKNRAFSGLCVVGFLILLAGLALTEQALAQQVLYREIFPAAGAARYQNAIDAGWFAERKGGVSTNELSIFTTTLPPSTAGVNSCSNTSAPDSNLFWSPKTHDILLYTTELNVPVANITSISWDSKNSFDCSSCSCNGSSQPDQACRNKSKMRTAILIGGTWYVSDDYFTTQTTDMTYDGGNNRWNSNVWETHLYQLAGKTYGIYDIAIPSAGRIRDPGQTLPTSGIVAGFGLFLDGDIAGTIRIDNYTILGFWYNLSGPCAPPANPALKVTKGASLSPSGPFEPFLSVIQGSTVYYQIIVSNVGDVDLQNVSLNDSVSGPFPCGGASSLCLRPSLSLIPASILRRSTRR